MASLGYMAINSLDVNLKLLGIGTWMTIMRTGQGEKGGVLGLQNDRCGTDFRNWI